MPTELLLPREGLSHAWGCHVLPAAVPLRSLLNARIPVSLLLTTAQQDSVLHPSLAAAPVGSRALGRGSNIKDYEGNPTKEERQWRALTSGRGIQLGRLGRWATSVQTEFISSMGCIMQEMSTEIPGWSSTLDRHLQVSSLTHRVSFSSDLMMSSLVAGVIPTLPSTSLSRSGEWMWPYFCGTDTC